MTDKLMAWLVSPKGGGYSASLAAKAVDVLVRTAGNLQQGLYKANQDVYSLLKYGAKVKENPGEPEKTVYFIDWEHSHNNEFAIAEEVTIKSRQRTPSRSCCVYQRYSCRVIELKSPQCRCRRV